MITGIFTGFINLIFGLIKGILPYVAILVLFYFLQFHIGYRKAENRNEEKFNGKLQKENKWKELFIEFPRRMGQDKAQRNPNHMTENGLIIFEGRQGSGKTSSMVKYALDLKKKYPAMLIHSNMRLKGMDKLVKTPKDFLKYKNGELGQCILIDEIQLWWNSKNSINLDSSITSFVTSLRKERRQICGTCQQFYMLSKDLRTQTKLIYSCHCIGGALNFIIVKAPQIDSAGEVKKMSFKKIYFFVQTDELRNAYDTTEIINTLNKFGLKERSEKENG